MSVTRIAGLRSGSVMCRSCHQELAPSTAAASYNVRSIFCSPASSSRATNGVVFHTSARITGIHAVQVLMNQTIGCSRIPAFTSSSLAMPPCDSKMNRQRSAATTVGIAHGTSTAARTNPRPRNVRFIASARKSPISSSSVIDTKVKKAVCPSAPQKRGSLAIST